MKTLLAWSSGKDSAWALHVLRRQNVHVAALLTTLNEAADRVAMHGVRRALLEAQAEAAGLPVWQIPLPWPCSNEDYESQMAEACRRAVAEGFDSIAFGDLFLRDVREYRERQLAGSGLTPLFPLWEIPTAVLAREMIAGGLRARLTASTRKALDGSVRRPRVRSARCWRICRRAWIPAAKTASSTRLPGWADVPRAHPHRVRRDSGKRGIRLPGFGAGRIDPAACRALS